MSSAFDALERRLENLESEAASIRHELKNLQNKSETSSESSPLPVSRAPAVTSRKKGPVDHFFDNLRISFTRDFETMVGGNILSKLGIFAMLLAVAWLIKLAIDNQWLNQSVRIWLSIGSGTAFMAWGIFLHKKKLKFIPPAVIGGGAGIIFIALFSGYYFYSLMSASETFISLLAITTLLSFLSVQINRQSLYIFGFTGAIILPLAMSTGENSYRFLLSYLVLLNLAYYGVSRLRDWRFASFYTLTISYSVFFGWSPALSKSSFLIPFLSITAIYLIHAIRDLAPDRKSLSLPASIGGLLNHLLYFISLAVLFDFFHFDWLPVGRLIIVGMILLQLKNLQARENKGYQTFKMGAQLLAAFILFIGIEATTTGNATGVLYTIFCAVLAIFAVQHRLPALQISAALLWLVTISEILFTMQRDPSVLLLNIRFLTGLIAASALIYTGFIATSENRKQKFARGGWLIAGLVVLLGSSFAEISDFILNEHHQNLGYSYVLTLYGAVLVYLGFRWDSKETRIAGLALLSIMVLKLYLYDIWTMSKTVRIIAGFSLGLALLSAGIWFERRRKKGEHQNEN